MRKINDNEYEIETYEDGVLHFVIGCEYSGESRHLESFNKRVTGILKHSVSYGLYIVVGSEAYVVDEKTLRYL